VQYDGIPGGFGQARRFAAQARTPADKPGGGRDQIKKEYRRDQKSR